MVYQKDSQCIIRDRYGRVPLLVHVEPLKDRRAAWTVKGNRPYQSKIYDWKLITGTDENPPPRKRESKPAGRSDADGRGKVCGGQPLLVHVGYRSLTVQTLTLDC